MTKGNRLLMVFVKNEELGKVKTRLAKSVGDERAMEIYRQLLSHTLNLSLKVECHKQVHYAWYIPEKDSWLENGFEQKLQSGQDLGGKMNHSFKGAFEEGHLKVLIIGSDCIELGEKHLRAAFEALESHDIVVGPAKDGGYYLLGMKKLHSALFQNKKWSTSEVLPATLADIDKLGLSHKLLPELSDIDHQTDLLGTKLAHLL